MTPTTEKKLGKLVHVACIFSKGGEWRYLFLRNDLDGHFTWHEEIKTEEVATDISAMTVEEALRLAPRRWNNNSFRNVICGFRYTLPERDEHGINALFHQMTASYASMNGVYYDDELGNNCYVQNASEEALELWRRLKTQQRLGYNSI